MQRIMVIGGPGAGKSTFARQLAQQRGLPVFYLDEHYFLPGWVWPSDEDFETTIANLIQKAPNGWVMDGNYSASSASRLAVADTLIFLDLPLYIRLWRSLKRWWNHKKVPRLGLSPHCQEKFDWYFLKLHWVWPKRHRQRWFGIARQHPHITFVHFTSPHAVAHWLKKHNV